MYYRQRATALSEITLSQDCLNNIERLIIFWDDVANKCLPSGKLWMSDIQI